MEEIRLSVEATKEQAMRELEPMLMPARKFIAHVKEAIMSGVDTLDKATLSDWMFIIPTMYGELRCLEADCLLTADLMDSHIDKVKADAIADKGTGKVTDARALAAQATHELQVQQQSAKFMARTINGLWSQMEMLIFSVRAMFESKVGGKVKNDVGG